VLLDVRGLRCPLVLVKAREAVATLPSEQPLIVLATDREAPIDLAALASDLGRSFAAESVDGGWRCTLGPRRAKRAATRR
jgi:tRNA 2-thiouridine synthesizing protein A